MLKSQSSLNNHQFFNDNIQSQMQLTNIIIKAKAKVFDELMIMIKRYYLIYLYNKIVDEFVRAVFSDMKSTYFIFKTIQEKIKKNYKD